MLLDRIQPLHHHRKARDRDTEANTRDGKTADLQNLQQVQGLTHLGEF